MKKLYSFLLVAIVGLLSFGALATTVTFKTNIAGSVYLYNTSTYQNIAIDGTELTTEISSSINVNPNGQFTIEEIVNQKGKKLNTYIQYSEMEDGDVITITVKEKEARNLTVVANAEHIYISDYNYYSHNGDDQVDGAWIFKNMPDYSPITVYANDGYAITEIKDDSGTILMSGLDQSYYFYGQWTGDKTIYVTSINLDDIRTNSCTIKIIGNPSAVRINRTQISGDFTPNENVTEFKFADTELPLYISHTSYNKTLYKVNVDGVPAGMQGSQYVVRPTNGSVIEIDTDYPDIDVPVKFNLSNDNIAGVISEFRVDNNIVSTWNTEDFTVKLGSIVNMSFNYTDYDITSISVNGEKLSSFYSHEFTVTDIEGYTIDINATKKAGYKVTVYCENYNQLTVYNGYGYSNEPTIELTGVETTFEISPSKSYVTFKAKNSEYAVSTIDCTGPCSVSYQTQVSVNGTDAYIEVGMEKVERNRQVVVYLQPDAPWHPNYTYIKLSPYKETEYTAELKPGYQIIKFASFDNTTFVSFAMSDYYSPVVGYQNETPFDSNIYQMDLKDGDVIKAFAAEPEKYSVTYDIEESMPVKVFHDYITAIENPAVHTVFAGTEIHIKPLASEAEVNGKLIVKVNNAAIAANEDGFYTAIVNADTKIEAYLDGNSGVENVDIDNNNLVNVYNIHGIEVLHEASADQIKQLPAGIYVAGSKKIVVR